MSVSPHLFLVFNIFIHSTPPFLPGVLFESPFALVHNRVTHNLTNQQAFHYTKKPPPHPLPPLPLSHSHTLTIRGNGRTPPPLTSHLQLRAPPPPHHCFSVCLIIIFSLACSLYSLHLILFSLSFFLSLPSVTQSLSSLNCPPPPPHLLNAVCSFYLLNVKEQHVKF